MPVDGEDVDSTSSDTDSAGEAGDGAPMVSSSALEADAELDKLLDEMSREERNAHAPAPPVPEPASVTARADEAPSFDVPLAVAPGDPLEPLMSVEEREALKLSGIAAATDAAEEHDAVFAAATGQSGREPLPVVVLELINAPLSFVPDRLRDVLGKVAILTLVNSLAVLIYVLFIRR